MAEVEPPLARAPFQQHTSNGSLSSRPTTAMTRNPTSPRMSAPNTPDQERSTDPLSAHIMARTQTDNANGDSPLFRRGLSELVLDKAREMVAPEPSTNVDVDRRDRKKRVSFFAKLRGQHTGDDEHVETMEELNRSEGAHASTFCTRHKTEKPTYIRVRSSNKPKREFDNLFLAQELIGDLSDETASIVSSHVKPSAIWSMKFSDDGRYLATGGQDMVVRVWRVLSSPKDRMRDNRSDPAIESSLNAAVFMSKPHREYRGHTADVLDLSWSKNNFLLSSSMDKTVRLWHISREECLCCFQHSDFVTSIAFHPLDDRFFVSGSLDCKLRLWNIPEKKVANWNELPELITAVAFSPSGRMVIAGSFTGLCLFYETDGLRYHTQIHVRSSRGRNSQGSKITGIQTVSLNPDNPHSEVKILITSNDSRVRVYNLRDKSLETKFKGNENKCSQIRASFNDGLNYVICGSEDHEVYIWDAKPIAGNKDKKPFEHFESHGNIVTATAFAPNRAREHLASSGDPIYDIVNACSQRSLSGAHSATSHDTGSDSASHNSVDGNIIICADYSGRIKVFRQDSAMNLRNRANDRSDSASIRSNPTSKSVERSTPTKTTRPASVVSQDSISVVRKPHEFVIPTSPARARTATTASADDGSTTNGNPALQLNGTPIRTEAAAVPKGPRDDQTSPSFFRTDRTRPSTKEHSHGEHRHSSQAHRKTNSRDSGKPNANSQPTESDPYMAENGVSLGFYDIESMVSSARPTNTRMESTASWSEMQTNSAVRCRTCGGHQFAATQSKGDMQLTCLECNTIVHT